MERQLSGRPESGTGARVPVSGSQRHGLALAGREARLDVASLGAARVREEEDLAVARAVVDEAHVLVGSRELHVGTGAERRQRGQRPSAAARAGLRRGARRACSRAAAGGPATARGRPRPVRRATRSSRAIASFTRRSASAASFKPRRAVGRAADEDDAPARLAEARDRLGRLRLERDDVHDHERVVRPRAVGDPAAPRRAPPAGRPRSRSPSRSPPAGAPARGGSGTRAARPRGRAGRGVRRGPTRRPSGRGGRRSPGTPRTTGRP